MGVAAGVNPAAPLISPPLGFDDPSAFHKACRRLLDATPAEVTRRSAPGRSTT
jgi:AraC-like DNA-binding protein